MSGKTSVPYFTDEKDDKWPIVVDLVSIRKVKEATGIMLTEVGDAKSDTLDRMANDVILLVDILYVLCRDKCEDRKLTEESFAKRLGPVFEEASEARFNAIINFFPPRQRKMMQEIFLKSRETEDKKTQMASESLAKVLDVVAEKELERTRKAIEAALAGN